MNSDQLNTETYKPASELTPLKGLTFFNAPIANSELPDDSSITQSIGLHDKDLKRIGVINASEEVTIVIDPNHMTELIMRYGCKYNRMNANSTLVIMNIESNSNRTFKRKSRHIDDHYTYDYWVCNEDPKIKLTILR